MKLLGTIAKEQIHFDPSRPDHLAAYWGLKTTGRQDQKLRFLLEPGFTNVLQMMQVKIADWAASKSIAPTSVVKLERRK